MEKKCYSRAHEVFSRGPKAVLPDVVHTPRVSARIPVPCVVRFAKFTVSNARPGATERVSITAASQNAEWARQSLALVINVSLTRVKRI
jgi:hypothetical protein